jgi:hypothetical protein
MSMDIAVHRSKCYINAFCVRVAVEGSFYTSNIPGGVIVTSDMHTNNLRFTANDPRNHSCSRQSFKAGIRRLKQRTIRFNKIHVARMYTGSIFTRDANFDSDDKYTISQCNFIEAHFNKLGKLTLRKFNDCNIYTIFYEFAMYNLTM